MAQGTARCCLWLLSGPSSSVTWLLVCPCPYLIPRQTGGLVTVPRCGEGVSPTHAHTQLPREWLLLFPGPFLGRLFPTFGLQVHTVVCTPFSSRAHQERAQALFPPTVLELPRGFAHGDVPPVPWTSPEGPGAWGARPRSCSLGRQRGHRRRRRRFLDVGPEPAPAPITGGKGSVGCGPCPSPTQTCFWPAHGCLRCPSSVRPQCWEEVSVACIGHRAWCALSSLMPAATLRRGRFCYLCR